EPPRQEARLAQAVAAVVVTHAGRLAVDLERAAGGRGGEQTVGPLVEGVAGLDGRGGGTLGLGGRPGPPGGHRLAGGRAGRRGAPAGSRRPRRGRGGGRGSSGTSKGLSGSPRTPAPPPLKRRSM